MILNFLCILRSGRVSIGSSEHILPIVLAIVLAVILINFAKKNLDSTNQRKVLHYLALFVSGFVMVFHLYYIGLGGYNTRTDLPLFLCSFLAIIIPIFTYYRKFWMYEVLLFWIIAGTSQGVLTPDIAEGFPAFDYIRYWVVHLGLLTIIFYATFVLKMRPNFKSVFKSLVALQFYLLVMMGINYLLGSNYCYLNYKPESASVLDYLGEWPYYILIIEAILIPLFLLIYFPFYLSKKAST